VNEKEALNMTDPSPETSLTILIEGGGFTYNDTVTFPSAEAANAAARAIASTAIDAITPSRRRRAKVLSEPGQE
jgi:hypothetical protein